MSASACPAALVLFQFGEGNLPLPQRDYVADHIVGCEACRARVDHGAAGGEPAGLADLLEPLTVQVSAPATEPAAGGPAAVTVGWDTDGPAHDAPSSLDFGPQSQGLSRGAAVGRYLIVEPLGSGGLGDVYTAYDPELDRCVAVKVLRPSMSSEESWEAQGTGSGRDRLMREAKALARLAHPNVVAVHDVGQFGENVFIAMERVDGVTLSQWGRAQTHSWTEIRDVFLGAGAGLAAAHAAGIVHRDFKPQNVIVGPDGRPRVLDFGLARAVQGDEGTQLIAVPQVAGFEPTSGHSLDEAITMAGTVMGTPQYMAPEQFEGSDSTGPAADQFGFCAALWMALYRERPYQGADIPQLVAAACAGTITEPRERHGVPGWLHKVLLRGLATEPRARFASMDELLVALQHDKRSRRRQWVALGVVALASAVGAAGVALALSPSVTSEQRDTVEVLANEARAAAARSYYVYPSPIDAEGVTAYRKVLELEALEGAADELGQVEASDLRGEFSGTLTLLGDRYFEREGGRAFAADYYAAALIFEPDNEHARDRTTLTPGEIGQLRNKAAAGEFSASELAAAASLSVLAVEDEQERREQLVALYAGDQAPSLSTSTRLEALLGGDEVEAIERASAPRRAASRRRAGASAEPPPPDPPGDAPLLVEADPESDPGTESGDGQPSDTEGPDAKAEPISAPTLRDPGKAADVAAKGRSAFRKGRFSEAEALFHRALGHDRRNSKALAGLARVAYERGSYHKAVQYATKAMRASPRNGDHRILLGDAYFKTLDYPAARREYQKAQSLGHAYGQSRLKQLDRRVGK